MLESSKLWREVATKVSQDYPDVELNHILVDACAYHLIRNPSQFDVMVTGNIFGDILTDEAAVLVGSLGMCPSAATVTPSKVSTSRFTAPRRTSPGRGSPTR